MIILPNYANSLDGPIEGAPASSTAPTVEAIATMGRSVATIELGATLGRHATAGEFLRDHFGVPLTRLRHPVGIEATDELFAVLESLSGRPTPQKYLAERGRLIDGYVDGHKYVAGKRAFVYGEEDLVAATAGFLAEIGVRPAPPLGRAVRPLCGGG